MTLLDTFFNARVMSDALPELLNEANDSQALYANPSPLILAALIYVAFLWPMVRLVSVLEARMSRGRAH